MEKWVVTVEGPDGKDVDLAEFFLPPDAVRTDVSNAAYEAAEKALGEPPTSTLNWYRKLD